MTRARRGVTLTELLVFIPIGLTVLGLAWNFFSSGFKKGKATDVKIQSLQQNLVLTLSLERDLDRLYEARDFRPKIASDGSALEFYRSADTSPGATWEPLRLQRVFYRFDAFEQKVYRQVDDGGERPFSGRYELVHFRVENPPGPTDPPPDPGDPLIPAPSVVITIISVPPLKEGETEADRKATDRTTLVSAVSRRWLGSRTSYDFWNPIPYVPPSPNPP